jgi:hypothetical protein
MHSGNHETQHAPANPESTDPGQNRETPSYITDQNGIMSYGTHALHRSTSRRIMHSGNHETQHQPTLEAPTQVRVERHCPT